MRLSLKAMAYFLNAVDRRSIVQAAQAMNVVPSAVASAIDAVEAEFGLTLVQRFRAKGIQPTAAGLMIAEKIRHLLEEYDDVIIGGHALRDALSGRLSIGYYAPMAPAFLPAVLAPILSANPGITLQFTECNNESAQQGLIDGTFDVIVFVSDNVSMGIDCTTLLDAPPYLLVPRSHALAKRRSVQARTLSALDLILLDLPFTTQYLRGLLDAHGIVPRVVATASSTEMIRNLVAAGIGCSILNMRPIADSTYSGNAVVEVPISPQLGSLRLVLAHVDGNPRRLVRAVKQACQDYFAAPAAQRLIVSNKRRNRDQITVPPSSG